MEQVNVMVFGRIVAHQAELEAMRLQNEIDKELDRPATYQPETFFEKADEIRSTVSELFR